MGTYSPILNTNYFYLSEEDKTNPKKLIEYIRACSLYDSTFAGIFKEQYE